MPQAKHKYGWRPGGHVVHRQLAAENLPLPMCVTACEPDTLRTIARLVFNGREEINLTDDAVMVSTRAEDVTCPKCEQLGHGRQLPEIPE